MKSFEQQLKEKGLNPPYDCPHYFSNWNCDDSCKLGNGDYCNFNEFIGCSEYNNIFGINLEEED